ncbi:hypothetical protein BDN70DRAFT_941472 [Pholiota conissans]|uniref:RING-type domain-containing protein n=1 Tax=Pholiota conissans TaxID=109636 RepID=A0A9P5ZFP6_9AGAR|nr:hypothetical protein BDN70DRAFT_941472 [Pholiota conissans]
MSSREPLWFCHECHAEMRPLMVPDPVCASCHGSFVEKMENAADDPRQFAAGDDIGDLGGAPGVDALLLTLQSLMDRGMEGRNSPNQRPPTGPSVTFEVRSPNGSRTVRFGGANTLGGRNHDGSGPASPDGVPNMSTFIRMPPLNPFGIPLGGPSGGAGVDRQNISGALMAQYLMALLGHNDTATLGMPENGRMGDYVFNQEALDQIISQIMENSNAHRPVPATEEVIAKLPREVLMEGSERLEQDCAVCKEQFKLDTEDPDEQIVVTLPCKHPFHQPCILPWLSSSGTCPVCRFQLVPQPEQHAPPGRPGADNGGSRSPPSPNAGPPSSLREQAMSTGAGAGRNGAPAPGNGNRGPEPGGLFHSLFSGLSGFAHGSHNNHAASNSNNTPSTSHNGGSGSSSSPNHDPSHPRSWSPSWGGTSGGSRPRSPRPTSPQPIPQQRSPPPRRSSSDPASPNSHSTSPRGRRSGNSNNLPGGWADELD